jgi:peptidoglycan/LPS O-acetylase OafA/YrhL
MTLFAAMGMFRLVLAWSVLLEHSKGHGFFGLGFLTGRLAVQSFFIISGFYMALVLTEKYVGPGRYWTFLVQRFLRLYPAYVLIMVAILVVDGITSLVSGAPFGCYEPWFQYGHQLSRGAFALLIENNLNLLGQDLVSLLQFDKATGELVYFPPPGHPFMSVHFFFVNRPTWTLGVELAFYLFAPFLVCRSIAVQASVLAASLVLRGFMPWLTEGDSFWSYVQGEGTPWTYVFFPSNLCFFLAGSIGYRFYKLNRPRIEQTLPSLKWVFILFAIFIATYDRLPGSRWLWVILVPLVCVMVPLLFAATRSHHLDRLVGELSYPFYLLHLHVLLYMQILFAGKAQWIFAPACVMVTLLLSYLFYRFIETRTEHFREELYRKAKKKGRVHNVAPIATSPSPQIVE